MDKDEKEKLEQERLAALKHIEALLPIIKVKERELSNIKNWYKIYLEQFKKADYALAQIDGRLERVNIERREKKVMELSLDQIKNIAEKLGVRL